MCLQKSKIRMNNENKHDILMGSLHDLQSVYYTMGFFQFAMLRVEFTAVVTG